MKNNLWFVYAITAGLFWGVWGVVAKLISEDVNPFMNHLLFSGGMLLTLPFVIKKCTRATFSRKGFIWVVLPAVLQLPVTWRCSMPSAMADKHLLLYPLLIYIR